MISNKTDKTQVMWCKFHNLPLSRCSKTQSQRCEIGTIPIEEAREIAKSKINYNIDEEELQANKRG